MTARQQFEQQGKLYPCPNKEHRFKLWRVVGQWQWAQDRWSTLTDAGVLQNDFLRIGAIETTDGIKAYSVVVWKLSLMFGFARA
jgi:hypothetical protein